MEEVYSYADLRAWSDGLNTNSAPIQLGVLGDPVAHSASPPMQQAALDECGISARYGRLHIRANELPKAFPLLRACNFRGVNCTIPHKATALQLMDRVDAPAARLGVVNTVVFESTGMVGYNTDGPGFSRALQAELGVALQDLRVLVLGAGGGAGRALATQCALEQCLALFLVNRTTERAQTLATEIAPLLHGGAGRVSAIPWTDDALQRALQDVDLVVNCTSLGMRPTDAPPLQSEMIPSSLLVLDTIYTARQTPLMLAAEAAGARSVNGLAMLLHQGALSFEIWFQREAPLAAMQSALHARLEQQWNAGAAVGSAPLPPLP